MMNTPQTLDSTSDLAHYIATAPLIDSHEHLPKEEDFLKTPPDILHDLFCN